MNCNKLLTLLCLVFFSIFFSISSLYSAANLKASFEEVSSNIIPGGDFLIKIRIENKNIDVAEINSIDLNLNDNFELLSKSEDFENENFCSLCSKYLTYYLKANSNLESGMYSVKLKIQYDEQITIEEEAILKVTGEPKLILKTETEKNLFPGKNFLVNFSLENVGTGNSKNIRIKSLSENIGFLNEDFLYLDEIYVKEKKEIIQKEMIISQDINTGFIKIPFEIIYEDNQNNKYSIEDNIGINLLEKSNLVIQNLKIDKEVSVNSKFELFLRIENDGFGKAKNVRIKLDGEFEGLKEAFFGSIEKGEDYPQIFNLIPKKEGETQIDFNVIYEDDFGEHKLNRKLNIFVIPEKKTNYEEFFIKYKLYIISIISIILILKLISLFICKKKTS